MSRPDSQGALVLLCRSAFANHFGSFKSTLTNRLRDRYADRIRFTDIHTLDDLASSLFEPTAPFDIAELHILAEFDAGRLSIDPAREIYVEADRLGEIKPVSSPRPGATGLLPNATINLWYLARDARPGIDLLNAWEQCFRRRSFFLPLTRLKDPLKPPPKKPPAGKAVTGIAAKEFVFRLPSFNSETSLLKIILVIAFIGGINHFVVDEAGIGGKFDRVVSYRDSPDEIAWLTADLKSNRGRLAEHSWVFRRTRWDFSFFVASQWLRDAARELNAAAGNRGAGDEYWGNVYRELLDANFHRLDNVAGALRDYGREMDLDPHDLASFVLSFVQYIPYRVPDNRLGLLAPPQTVNEVYGDCDSKSLLYALIMRKLGYDTVMYVNQGLSHAMAGINTAASGAYLSYQGARYYFAETTAIGSRIGQLRGSTRGWRLVKL